jgi:hypothetical protein
MIILVSAKICIPAGTLPPGNGNEKDMDTDDGVDSVKQIIRAEQESMSTSATAEFETSEYGAADILDVRTALDKVPPEKSTET